MTAEFAQPTLPGRDHVKVQRIATAVLLLLSASYIIKGFYYLVFKDPSDLHMKWIDEQYVMRGRNPFDVFLRQLDVADGKFTPRTTRNAEIFPEIGPIGSGGYPPWFYFPGLVIFRPHWQASRLLFAGLDLMAVIFIPVWILRDYARFGRTTAWFLLATLMAIGGICNTIEIGQYGLLAMALIGGALWAERHNHWVISGLCLGLSASKPTVGAVFFLAWMIKLHWKSLIVACAYLGIATAVVCTMIKTGPLEMLGQVELTSRTYFHYSYDFIVMVSSLGVPDVLASRIVAAVCLAIAAMVFVIYRKKSLLFHCSVAAIFGRVATYHHLYDNVMMMPLMLYCAIAWLERGGRVLTINLAVLGGILWAPETLLNLKVMQAAQLFIYPLSLAVVLAVESRDENSGGRVTNSTGD